MKKQILVALLCCLVLATATKADDLTQGFQKPPASARPWVYWFWLNSNITPEGITADLEAMKRVGIGGVLIMEVDQGAPVGPVAFMGPQWREMFKRVCSEAQRLGLEVNMNNDAGWNGSGGPWIKPEQSMQKVVWSETDIAGPKRFEGALAQPKAVAGFYSDITVLAFPTPGVFRIAHINFKAAYDVGPVGPQNCPILPPEMVIERSRIVDLTSKTDKTGHLVWDVPPGKWTVLRFGHTSTGAENSPAPASGRGLECDKLSKKGIEANFAGMMDKLIADVGPLAGRALTATHIDSWENGSQNWTAQMREEFRHRRGYDMLPFLPVMTGRVVDNLEISERFLWDLRRTISELVVENYAGWMRNLAHAHGLRFTIEAYGSPCDNLPYAGESDEPMGEFWSPSGAIESCRGMASAAHVYGKRIVGAEAFTAADHEKWLEHPASIKALGDRAFCEGINRFVFHRYALQPWHEDRRPGMMMGPWGQHYERTQTWWEWTGGWHEYLARCQFMLRQGLFVADICHLQAEASPQGLGGHGRNGYDWDDCPAEVVLTRMSVKNGRLVLPDGMSYRVLALPELETMTPQLLRKIKQLVAAGATVIGSKPPVKSPSLSDDPRCNTQVRKLADELWGKGKVVSGKTAEQLLAERGVKSDFSARLFPSTPNSQTPINLRYIHRRDGDVDIYFVTNQEQRDVETLCAFRVTGKQPELWDAVTGSIRDATVWSEGKDQITLPLKFDPAGSVFVVFRKPAKESGTLADRAIHFWNWDEFKPLQEIIGPWTVSFDPRWGGPAQPLTFEKLEDWSKRSEDGIKYYSGTATYRTTFVVDPKSLPRQAGEMQNPKCTTCLDLGRVAVMAEVKLNGKDLGILWKPPYRVNITNAVKPGENMLEVKVVDLWVNRMIGDEQLPEDSDRNPDGTLKSWPKWLQEGKPSPTGRYTFESWRLWKKGNALLESGLIGPVQLLTTETASFR